MKNDSALKKLAEALIGNWKISGEAKGSVRYKWLHEGIFLSQEFDIIVFGRRIKGVEIIGRLRKPNQEPTREIWSRAYIFAAGETYDYVYELKGRRLVIWFGEPGSSNKFTAKIAENGGSYEGAWEWPGGGYKMKATRASKPLRLQKK